MYLTESFQLRKHLSVGNARYFKVLETLMLGLNLPCRAPQQKEKFLFHVVF